jgi:hypothetical protein
MQHLPKAVTLLVFSLLFLLVFLPLGALIRLFADPLRLRKSGRSTTYFNMAQHGLSKARSSPPAPAHKRLMRRS